MIFNHNLIQIFLQSFAGLVQNLRVSVGGMVVFSCGGAVLIPSPPDHGFLDWIRFKINQSGGMVVVKLVINNPGLIRFIPSPPNGFGEG